MSYLTDAERTNELLAALIDEVHELRRSPPFVPSVLSIETTRIPPDATLAFSVPRDILDSDLRRLREELRAHFGDRKILVFRAGDVKIGVITEEMSG